MCLVKNKIICNKYALKEQEVQLNLIKKIRFHNSFRERARVYVYVCIYIHKPEPVCPRKPAE